jgi:hypothetical protein
VHVDDVAKEHGGINVPKENSSRRKEVGIGLEREVVVKSKISTHFIKSKISPTPMETILTIL